MVEVNSVSALKVLRSLNSKKEIRILGETKSNTASLPGEPMALAEFKAWVAALESAQTITLEQAKERWENQKTNLQKNTQ